MPFTPRSIIICSLAELPKAWIALRARAKILESIESLGMKMTLISAEQNADVWVKAAQERRAGAEAWNL